MNKTKPTYEQLRDDEAFKLQQRTEIDYPQQPYSSEDVYYAYRRGSDFALTLPLSVLAEKHEGVKKIVHILRQISYGSETDILTGLGIYVSRDVLIKWAKEALKELEEGNK